MEMLQLPRSTLRMQLRQLWDRDTEPTEVIAGGFALYWAVLLSLQLDTFGTSPSYAVMRNRAPEWVWACVFALLVVLPILAWLRNSLWLRLVGLAGHSLIWPGVAYMVLAANPYSTGGVYGVLALGISWVFCRVCGTHGPEVVALGVGIMGRVRRGDR